uniref:Uncharacterized protein LOC110208038 n=1 Tax=Phascolarctos cinereus TaxID=38626 RepID=A0A6P5K7P5_PHACI|nr:uncharacterized protein LOC110208038 [Phascolarctos cinereus]
MFIAVPQTRPNHSVTVSTVPVNPSQQTLPKPRHRIRATNALLGFLKLEPMLHSAGSISTGPNHCSRDTTGNWTTQPNRPSSLHPNLLCPWKTVSVVYRNDHLPKSLEVPLSQPDQKTRTAPACGPHQLQQAGDATGPVAHGLLQMEKKPCETVPVRTGQDQGTRQLPLNLHLQDKTLHVPDYQVIPPPHPEHPSCPNAQVSLQMEQEHRKTMPLGTGNQAPNLTGQDHWVIPPFLGMDGQKTILFVPHYQATPPPSPNYQAEDIPGSVAYTLKAVPPRIRPQATTIGQDGGTAPPVVSHKQDINQLGTMPQATASLTSDYQSGKVTHPNAQLTYQSDLELWGAMTGGTDHQNMSPFGWGYGATSPPQSTKSRATIPPSFDHWTASLPQPEFQTEVNPDPHQAILLASPTHQPEDIQGDPKAQVSLQEELKQCETILEETNQQTPNPTDHDQGAILRLSTDDKETISPGPDHCTMLPPSPDLQAENIPDPNDQDSWQLKLEHSETIEPATKQQSKNPFGEDPGGTLLPLSKDKQETTPCGPDLQDVSHHGPDYQTEDIRDASDQDSVQPEQHWQIVQPGPDQQTTNPTDQDHIEISLILGPENQETILLDTDHQAVLSLSPVFQAIDTANPGTGVSCKTGQKNKERMPLGSEHKATTLLGYDLEATAPPPGSDLQDKTLLGPGNHSSLPANTDPNVGTSGPATDTLMRPEQGFWETMPLRTDQQVTDTTGCDHWVTPPPPGSDHQATCPPSPDLSGAVISIQKEQEEWKTLPKEISPQDALLSEVDIMLTPTLGLDSSQDKTPPSPDYRATSSHSPDDQAKDTRDPIAPTWVHTEQEPGETVSLTIDQQAMTAMGQDQEAATPPPHLESRGTAQCGPDCQAIPMCSPDHQDENTAALVSLQPLANIWEVVPQEKDQQATILMDLGFRTSPPLLIHPQDPTLRGLDYQTIPLFNPSETFSDPDPQNAPPWHPECSAKWLMGPDPQVPHSTSLDPQVTPLPSSNQSEARLDSTKPQGTTQTQLCNQETALLSFTKHGAVLPSGPGLQTKCPRGLGPQAEVGPNVDPRVDIQSRLQCQTQPVLKRKASCLNYIKPHTVEGGIVPDSIVQAIISSIPQEKIKNDVYKQILLRKMKKFSPYRSSRYNSSYYPVCLLCASWIPNGCPHKGMKYPSEAQLLAVPTPMPGFEELGVRFVLQMPHLAACSYLDFPYSHYSLQRYPYGPPAFSASSYSELGLARSSRPKWPHFILGKAHQPGETSQDPEFIRKMPVRKHSPREEETGNGRTFFKSLLERFQWKLKD